MKKCDMPVLPKAAVGKDVNPRRLADSPKGLNPDEWWALFHHKVSGDVLPDDVLELVPAVSLKQITELSGDASQGSAAAADASGSGQRAIEDVPPRPEDDDDDDDGRPLTAAPRAGQPGERGTNTSELADQVAVRLNAGSLPDPKPQLRLLDRIALFWGLCSQNKAIQLG